MLNQTSPAAPVEERAFHGASLELRDLTLAYGEIEVLRKVSISVAPGTTTCIIGPSGSGKSTLLRGINRLHEPKSGDVLLAGRSVLKENPDALRHGVPALQSVPGPQRLAERRAGPVENQRIAEEAGL